MSDNEQPPFEVGAEVQIISAPNPEIVGQTGTIVSAHCGQYYAVDVAGAVSYLPDAGLGGERPAAAGAPEPPPVAEPVALPPPDAQALAALGGPSVAGQVSAARIHALGVAVLARTKASSPDAALLAIESALVGASQLAALRAKIAELDAKLGAQTAATELRARTDKLTAALRATGLGREAFFDVATKKVVRDGKEIEVESLTPKAVWLKATMKDLDDQLATLAAGANPVVRDSVIPDPAALVGGDEIPEAVRRHAEKRGRGNDVKFMQRLAAELPKES